MSQVYEDHLIYAEVAKFLSIYSVDDAMDRCRENPKYLGEVAKRYRKTVD